MGSCDPDDEERARNLKSDERALCECGLPIGQTSDLRSKRPCCWALYFCEDPSQSSIYQAFCQQRQIGKLQVERDEAYERGRKDERLATGFQYQANRAARAAIAAGMPVADSGERLPAPPKIPVEQRPLSERRKLALLFWMKGAGFWSILIFTPFFIVLLASGRPVPGVVWGVATLDAFYAVLIGYSVLVGYMPKGGRK
jgi:hypothetical protein